MDRMILSMNEIFSSMDKTYHPLMEFLFVMFWGGNWKKSILPRAICVKTLTQRHDKLKFHPWIKRFYPWIKRFYPRIKRFYPRVKRFYPWIKKILSMDKKILFMNKKVLSIDKKVLSINKKILSMDKKDR